MTTPLAQHRRGITPRMRADILHDDAVCTYCGIGDPSEVDHVVPVSRGGGLDPENLVAACWRCNGEKRDNTPEEWAERRLSDGQPWPVPSFVDRVKDLIARGVIDINTEPTIAVGYVHAARNHQLGSFWPQSSQ